MRIVRVISLLFGRCLGQVLTLRDAALMYVTLRHLAAIGRSGSPVGPSADGPRNDRSNGRHPRARSTRPPRGRRGGLDRDLRLWGRWFTRWSRTEMQPGGTSSMEWRGSSRDERWWRVRDSTALPFISLVNLRLATLQIVVDRGRLCHPAVTANKGVVSGAKARGPDRSLPCPRTPHAGLDRHLAARGARRERPRGWQARVRRPTARPGSITGLSLARCATPYGSHPRGPRAVRGPRESRTPA
jgi:hypothetical protein